MADSDEDQLDAVVDIVVEALGGSIVGAYQYGSAVLGGLRPHSDIDVFVLIDRPTTTEERRHLVSHVLAVSGRRGTRIAGRPVELTIAQLDELVPWRRNPHRDFQYGEWMRADYEAGFVPAPMSDPDLAPLVTALLTASRTLVGAAACDVLDPVPHDRLVNAMREGIPGLLDELEEDTTNVLLTLARMAYTTRFGRITSKDDAAQWARDHLPPEHSASIVLARRIYLGEADEVEEPHVGRQALMSAERLAEMVNEG